VHLETTSDVASEGLKRYHEGVVDVLRDAIRNVPVTEREISGVTLAIKEASLPAAKTLIREFQRKLVALCEATTDADRVYHLEVGFVPLTTPSRTSPKESP
jgi:uncharacterized protein (TIGR02147 family)